MKIFSVIKTITTHPLTRENKLGAILRFLKWQIGIKLNPYAIIYPFTEKTKLVIQKGMEGATGNLYCGLHEYSDMAFTVHLLRKEDLFVDIGANIGSYTVLASGHVGARTISFEPVPSTFAHLVKNISVNQIQEQVTAYNVALGGSKREIDFTSSLDSMNHVASKNETNTIKVPVEVLDNILTIQDTPLLLKIDVEGFETEVIKGAVKTLQQKGLKAIIIELNGLGTRYGYNEQETHDILLKAGFKPYQYNPKDRTLIHVDSFGAHNTIYIKDLDFVMHRLKNAPVIRVLNKEI